MGSTSRLHAITIAAWMGAENNIDGPDEGAGLASMMGCGSKTMNAKGPMVLEVGSNSSSTIILVL